MKDAIQPRPYSDSRLLQEEQRHASASHYSDSSQFSGEEWDAVRLPSVKGVSVSRKEPTKPRESPRLVLRGSPLRVQEHGSSAMN
jgi:hypothetical protein